MGTRSMAGIDVEYIPAEGGGPVAVASEKCSRRSGRRAGTW
jgi:hypothetical protein